MSEKRNINLTIADISLNLDIPASEEEIVRKAAKEINERVIDYKSKNKEPEACYFLAFVALNDNIRKLQLEQKLNDIEKINSKLDAYIKE